MGNIKIQFTRLRVPLLLFFAFLAIFFFAFRSLIFNLATNLIDWRDYSYITWIINLNINHLRNLDLVNLFNTNAFYPLKNTLFLSDTLLAQSVIGLPFSFFTRNPILIFNFVFLTTFILNYLSSYLLWDKLFKNSFFSFLGSLIVIFSPFFYTQYGHFQMLFFWPLFFGLYFLLDKKNNILSTLKREVSSLRKNVYSSSIHPRTEVRGILEQLYKLEIKSFLVGVFLAIQFLASVYLAFFFIIIILIFLFIELLKSKKFKTVFLKILLIFLTFIILDGIFIKGYLDAKKQFGIERDYGEFVLYSAHLSDYIFPQQKGLLYQNSLVTKWSSYNKHGIGELASFPGFILTITAFFGLFRFSHSKKKYLIEFEKTNLNYLFLLLILVGFTFSLGPRISFNGVYSEIPLPFTLLLKHIPFFDVVRATARWSFLLYLGLTYFSLYFFNQTRKRWINIVLPVILLLEIIPFNFDTYKDIYLSKRDETLKEICTNQKTVILEVPVTHFDSCCSLAEGLSYITKRQLASIYNGCYLVNGYSGYDLPNIQKIKVDLYDSISKRDEHSFLDTLKSSGAELLVLNKENMLPEINESINIMLKLQNFAQLGENIYFIK